MKPKTIFLATDLSCRCDRALDRAVSLAAEWRAKLVIVHVLQEVPPAIDLPSWRRPADPSQAAYQRVKSDMRGAEGVDFEVIVEQGQPVPVLLKLAKSLGCDLFVMGVARDETLGRSLLGTTVEKLTRQTDVPVLVVKSRPRGPYRKIVIATDFSEGSRSALEKTLALFPAARMNLFHAFNVAFEGIVNDKEAARAAAAKNALEESRSFLASTTAVEASGRPIGTICEYGEAGALLYELVSVDGIDLVSLGSEGRGKLAHMLIGSVAQHLMESLPVDLLVVRRRKS